MRGVAALLLGSAAINWPAIALDRAGVALLGIAALALALPASPLRRPAALERPRVPAMFDGLGLVEPELRDTAERAVAAMDNGQRPA